MLQENIYLEKLLAWGRKIIPKRIFEFLQPRYHWTMAWSAALFYRFPSRKMKVIGVTGTKGKSTVVYLASKIFEEAEFTVAAIGSLGYKIGAKEWPNILGNTMPGRFRLQKFLWEAKKAGTKYVILEVTSEGIEQNRHLGISFDTAVITNLEPEHIERHGGFVNYYSAKQKLFGMARNKHVLNADDQYKNLFAGFPAKQKLFYGILAGDLRADNISYGKEGTAFKVGDATFKSGLLGELNVYNALAALAVARVYNIDFAKIKNAFQKIVSVRGRLEEIKNTRNLRIFVDYAHTPSALKSVYKTMRELIKKTVSGSSSKLICVLGAAGGGRDKWKRPEFGKLAGDYCDEIVLTDEDPFDENPDQILSEILSGVNRNRLSNVYKVLDRREAIKKSLELARKNDIILITGKGSEPYMRLENSRKIPWDDVAVTKELLESKK